MVQGAYARDGVGDFYFDQQVADADPATFWVLNADFECSADDRCAYSSTRGYFVTATSHWQRSCWSFMILYAYSS